MKIAVIGAGAMGSVYAGLLAEAGNEVWAVDVWREHVDAINENGLRLDGISGNRAIPGVKAACDLLAVGPCDLYIIATKADGVEAAAQSILPLLTDDSIVLTIQNGLGAADRIRRHVPEANILLGVAGGFGASIKGPGHAHHNGMELIRLGELTGGLSDRVERIAQVWSAAGFTAKAYADIDQLIWEKFVCNVSFSGPCTVCEKRIGEMMADPELRKLSFGCGTEAWRVGAAKGVAFSFEDPEAYIAEFASKIPDARPSVYLDHLAGKRSEIDWINGMVPEVGREVGVAAPYNEVITALVKLRERAFA